MTVLLHRDRYSTSGVLARKLGVVVHDSESGDNSEASLVSFLKGPGDRPSPSHPGGKYGAGYHAVTDGLGGYVDLADASAGPYAAPPVNGSWWHICIPGAASQDRDDWVLDISRLHIRGVAQFIVDKWKADGGTWDVTRYLVATDLVKGSHGITSHREVANAWHATDHTDPGPSFPWDVLLGDVTLILNPKKPAGPFTPAPGRTDPPATDPTATVSQEDESMLIYTADNNGVWLLHNGKMLQFSSMDTPNNAHGLPTLGSPEQGIPKADLDRLLATYPKVI